MAFFQGMSIPRFRASFSWSNGYQPAADTAPGQDLSQPLLHGGGSAADVDSETGQSTNAGNPTSFNPRPWAVRYPSAEGTAPETLVCVERNLCTAVTKTACHAVGICYWIVGLHGFDGQNGLAAF